MVFGMRPEHLFEYHEAGKPGFERVDLKVDVVEPMGMETMVHFFLGGDPICARVAPETECHPDQILPIVRGMRPDAARGTHRVGQSHPALRTNTHDLRTPDA